MLTKGADCLALQEAEVYMVHLFQDSKQCAIHTYRVIQLKDIQLAQWIRGETVTMAKEIPANPAPRRYAGL